jgi:hypothetical protein
MLLLMIDALHVAAVDIVIVAFFVFEFNFKKLF